MSRECTAADEPEADEAPRINRRQRDESALLTTIGERYASCRLETFRTYGASEEQGRQVRAIHRVKQLLSNLGEHVRSGGNAFFYGNPGTGKDHLLVSILRVAIAERGFDVDWTNGQELYARFRDRIGTQETEEALVREFSRQKILAISDPIPPDGKASEFSSTQLYRVIDRRYRKRLSTFLTANATNEGEAIASLSGPVWDRIRENCFMVWCNWESYRGRRRPEWLEQ